MLHSIHLLVIRPPGYIAVVNKPACQPHCPAGQKNHLPPSSGCGKAWAKLVDGESEVRGDVFENTGEEEHEITEFVKAESTGLADGVGVRLCVMDGVILEVGVTVGVISGVNVIVIVTDGVGVRDADGVMLAPAVGVGVGLFDTVIDGVNEGVGVGV